MIFQLLKGKITKNYNILRVYGLNTAFVGLAGFVNFLFLFFFNLGFYNQTCMKTRLAVFLCVTLFYINCRKSVE